MQRLEIGRGRVRAAAAQTYANVSKQTFLLVVARFTAVIRAAIAEYAWCYSGGVVLDSARDRGVLRFVRDWCAGLAVVPGNTVKFRNVEAILAF